MKQNDFHFTHTNFNHIPRGYIHTLVPHKPGHNFKLQLFVSMDSPLQSFPPFAGAGFEQLRTRFCKPSSHVFEQGVHIDREDQLPFTNKKKKENMGTKEIKND